MKQILQYIPPYFATFIAIAAVCYLSLAPDPMPNDVHWLFNFEGADKVVHFIMYWGITMAFCFDYYRRTTHYYSERNSLIFAVITAILIGGILEILQQTICIGRSGDILDFVADAVGACLGILMGIKVFARMKTQE